MSGTVRSQGPAIEHNRLMPNRVAKVRRGSDRLADALHREFAFFAMVHRITYDDAKLLCMNGVSPR